MQVEVHAKLTGAGDGGCVICFPKDPEFYKSQAKDFLFQIFKQRGYTVYDNIHESKDGLKY